MICSTKKTSMTNEQVYAVSVSVLYYLHVTHTPRFTYVYVMQYIHVVLFSQSIKQLLIYCGLQTQIHTNVCILLNINILNFIYLLFVSF